MQVIMPNGHSLEEMARQIEFIKFVATSDGLESVLRQIADKQREADDAASRLQGLERAAREQTDKSISVLEQATDAKRGADEARLAAENAGKIADARISAADRAEIDLSQKVAAFENQVKLFTEAKDESLRIIQDREEAVKAREAAAEKVIEEYQDKLAELKKIAG